MLKTFLIATALASLILLKSTTTHQQVLWFCPGQPADEEGNRLPPTTAVSTICTHDDGNCTTTFTFDLRGCWHD